MSEDERKEYPDEIGFTDGPPIKRVKKLKEMTREDSKKYGMRYIRCAATDVRLSDLEEFH